MTDELKSKLVRTLRQSPVRLEPINDSHLETLKAACARDREIWEIFPVSMLDDNFQVSVERFHQTGEFVTFAVIHDVDDQQSVVGMTSYIRPTIHGAVEIGGTYIAAEVRGTGFNSIMKKLMIENAFSNGFHRIQFNVDTRNERSMAAVLKLGAKQEGVLRKDRITWTGYVRDTAIFSILKEEYEY